MADGSVSRSGPSPHRSARQVAGLLFLVILLTAIPSACSKKPTGPKFPSLTGVWIGSAIGLTFRLTLDESSQGEIGGSGSISGPGVVAQEMTVIYASHTHPDVMIELVVTGYSPFYFSGTFTDDDTIVGTITETSYEEFGITLHRH